MGDNVAHIPARPPAPDAVCITPTYEEIHAALDHARDYRMIAGIFGPAGGGKTTAASAYAAEVPGVRIFRATTRTRTAPELRTALAEEFGAWERPRSERVIFHAIHSVLSGHGRAPMLIIDEAHNIADSGIEMLRYLNDPHDGDGAVALALVGNPITVSMREGRNRAMHGQFLSRLRPLLMLDDTSDEDFEAFFDHRKIAGARPRASIKKAARDRGGLRAAAFIIDRAYATAGPRALELGDVERAIAFLGYI